MIIGDAPGISDEINNKPFSGDVGLLLNKMLKAIKLDRTKVYLKAVEAINEGYNFYLNGLFIKDKNKFKKNSFFCNFQT